MIAIIDYGMGNLRSVEKAFNRLNAAVKITADKEVISTADKLVLPGVGNFRSGMEHLRELGLIDILNKQVLDNNIPILGICLGMQLFTRHSEEGDTQGLGWIDATTRKFSFEKKSILKVPHIGWNTTNQLKKTPLFSNVNPNEPYYFVHSYFVECNNRENAITSTDYGITFDSSISKNNIAGVQFHPEKSHDGGMTLLKNFIELY